MDTLKKRILNKERLIGTHINLNDPCISKIVAKLGFDYIWIDMEHSYLSYQNLLAHINTIQAYGVPVIVRAPQNDFTATKKILEMGPDGIVFPMIKTAEQANELIAYTLYPPYGNRGYGPNNATSFGVDSVQDYIHNNHKDMCRFIQIEHKDAVDNLEEIIKNPYIDGYIFGANDLSGSIGELTRVYDPNTTALIDRALDILKKNDKYISLSTDTRDPELIKYWSDKGIQMISAASDFGSLTLATKQLLAALQKGHLGME